LHKMFVVNRSVTPDISLLGVKGIEIIEEMNNGVGKIAISLGDLTLLRMRDNNIERYLREARSTARSQTVLDFKIGSAIVENANSGRLALPVEMEKGILCLGTVLKLGNAYAVPCISKNGVWKIEPLRAADDNWSRLSWSSIVRSTRWKL
jgi:hypothetical protein